MKSDSNTSESGVKRTFWVGECYGLKRLRANCFGIGKKLKQKGINKKKKAWEITRVVEWSHKTNERQKKNSVERMNLCLPPPSSIFCDMACGV